MRPISRRSFNKAAAAGAAAFGWPAGLIAAPYTSRVALTKGFDRADNAFRAMQVFKQQISAAIGNKRIIIKPNVVSVDTPLADTHAEWLEGILEFLKSIGKTDIYVAESTAGAGTMAGYEMLGFLPLAERYPVKFIDLNQEGSKCVKVWKEQRSNRVSNPLVDLWTIRISNLLSNPDNYIISCPRIKTHNSVAATLSLKNVVMGSPMVDVGSYFYQTGSPLGGALKGSGTGNSMHGIGWNKETLNDNLYRMVKLHDVQPDLAVIDGYEGMQGEGPTQGTAVARQHLGICSPDWLAADRVCVRLMGHDKYNLNALGPYPAYLNYLGQDGFGEWDISKIEVVGESVDDNIVEYAKSTAWGIYSRSATVPAV